MTENKTHEIRDCGTVEIEFWFYDNPNQELAQSDYEHVQGCIRDGFIEGELCTTISNDDVYGYWKIIR